MRMTMFVPALFAVALAGSSALAEKPHRGAPDRLRMRGDVVDKSYQGAAPKVAKAAPQPATRSIKIDGGASRVSCSDVGLDCAAQSGGARAAAAESKASAGGRGARPPAFLDKILGSDRTNINEAGEDQGMSMRAAKRAWSNAASSTAHVGGSRGAAAAEQRAGAETKAAVGVPAAGNRMACNDAGECMMSSKAAKKQWAYQSVRAGTWRGPEAQAVTPAARAIADMKKGEKKSEHDKR